MSARSELQAILFAKNDRDYPRHWSQKKKGKPIGKKPAKKQQAEEDEQHEMSAQEELDDIIQFGPMMDRAWKKVINVAGHEDLRAINQIKTDLMSWNTSRRAIPEGIDKIQELQRKVFLKRAALGTGAAVIGVPAAMAITNRRKELSTREQLDSIINLSTDPRPRDQQGQFKDANGEDLSPEAMTIVYGQPQAEEPDQESPLRALLTKLKGARK